MIFLSASSVFDGDGDGDDVTITINRAMARAILDAGFDLAIWDDEITEEQRELIESGINSITEAL